MSKKTAAKPEKKANKSEFSPQNKTNVWGWRIGFASVLLLFLFYACHPWIFSRKPKITYDTEERQEDEIIKEATTKTQANQEQLSGHEFKLVESCLKEDLSNCYNYSYPEGYIELGQDKSRDDIAYLLDALEMEDIAEEASYQLYEEELPENIIEDGKVGKDIHYNHKNIKDIDVKIKHKPFYFGKQPVIAIVIDDMGVNVSRSRDIIKLEVPLTSSFLTYGPHLEKQIKAAQAAGHEIMAHVPMEPHRDLYTAPDGLKTSMSDEELKEKFEIMLKKFPEVRGVNNHMGSKFTENEQKMSDIMEVLAEHDLYFLDSKTTPKSVGEKTAKRYGVDYAHRHVFLDNNNDKKYILKQLAQTERIAKKNGYAVAIGHPKSKTYEALKEWLQTLPQKGIKLVHMSEIVKVLN